MLTRLRALIPLVALALSIALVVAPPVAGVAPYSLSISPSVPVSQFRELLSRGDKRQPSARRYRLLVVRTLRPPFTQTPRRMENYCSLRLEPESTQSTI